MTSEYAISFRPVITFATTNLREGTWMFKWKLLVCFFQWETKEWLPGVLQQRWSGWKETAGIAYAIPLFRPTTIS